MGFERCQWMESAPIQLDLIDLYETSEGVLPVESRVST